MQKKPDGSPNGDVLVSIKGLKTYYSLRGSFLQRLAGRDAYELEQVLKRMTERAYELDLVVPNTPGRLRAARALLLHDTLAFVRVRRPEYIR